MPPEGPSSSALVTPSFRGDFDRCALLVESVARHVPPSVPHYLVVDRRDVGMFRALSGGRTRLLVVEDVVPWWMVRIPGVRRFWWSWRSRPIKNWILQQIVKLSVPRLVSEETLFYVDSDVFFVGGFDPAALLADGKAPLFCEHGQRGLIPRNDAWHQVAARLLGLPVEESYDTNFIGNIICWKRDVALALVDHVARRAGKHWVQAIAGTWSLSEYVLYGLFATRLSRLAAEKQTPDPTERTLCYWEKDPLDGKALEALRGKVAEPKVAVMISAKSRTDVGAIRRAFGY